MKRLFLSLAMLIGLAVSVSAQNVDRSRSSYTFIGVQGGAQNTYNTHYAFGRTWTPTAQLSVGHFFSPHVGLRAGVNGAWAKSNAPFLKAPSQRFDYNYLTTNADVMVNMASICGNRAYYPVSFYVIGGFGINYAWNNDEALDLYNQGADLPYADVDHRRAMNLRLGGQLEVNLCKNVAFNLEATYNFLTAQRKQAFVEDRSQLVLLAGVNFKFGYKKAKQKSVKSVPMVPIVPSLPAVCDEKVEKPTTPVVKETEKTVYVFYSLRSSDATQNEYAKIEEMAKWLNEHPTAKATVTGYADKGTGTAALNKKYAQQRAEAVTKILVEKYGVAASRITTDSKGDTVQPFSENDQNRVAIVVGKE